MIVAARRLLNIRMISNPNVLMKLGNVYQYQLNEIEIAQLLPQQCLNIDVNNEQYLYQFENLLIKLNEYKRAIEVLTKSYDMNAKNASINHAYAHVITTENNRSSNNTLTA